MSLQALDYFPGDKADKMNKRLPPQRCKKSIKWLCDHVLSRNRRLARRKALTSSELNRPEFRPKKGASFCLLPWCCPSRGKHSGTFPKARKAPGYGARVGRRKGRWWGTVDPKCRSAPAEQLPGEERCSPPRSRAMAGIPRGLPGFSYSLPEDPLPAISGDRIIWHSSFLTTPRLGKAGCIFSAPESRNHRVQQKQCRIARRHIWNHLCWIYHISGVLFWSKCSSTLDKLSPFLNILLLPTSTTSQGWTRLRY